MAASNAFPMAVALSLVSSIWLKIPDMVLCMVSIMVRVLSMVAIICGNWASHLRHEHIQLIEVVDERFASLSVIWSTPSIASNMDLIAQQMGML